MSVTCPNCGLAADSDSLMCVFDGTPVDGSWGKSDGQTGDEATVVRDLLVGMQLGDYTVEQRIGMGGMGIVYRATQPAIGKTVAIKVLKPDFAENPLAAQRLLAEARAVTAVGHRSIVDIFNFGTLPDGRSYIVMEYLDGVALDEVIHQRAPMAAADVIPILQEICDALAAVHASGIVHRDLKPNNIFMVSKHGRPAYVKVLDFGLAKQGTTGRPVAQTQAGRTWGTPEYMAPEQARGEPVSPKTDLYALGVLAFQMLTGRLPFIAPSPVETLSMHLKSTPPTPSVLEPSVPLELDELVLALLAKRPEQRPASADAVRQRLERILRSLAERETGQARPAELPQSARTQVTPVVDDPRRATSADLPVQAGPLAPRTLETDRVSTVTPRRGRGGLIAAAVVAVLVLGAGGLALLRRAPPVKVQPRPVAVPIAKVTPKPPPEPVAPPVTPVTPENVVELPQPPKPPPEPAPAPQKKSVKPVARPPRPAPAPPVKENPGTLDLLIRGRWAYVSIDGGEKKVVNIAGSFPLAPGTHQLKVEKDGCKTYAARVSIKPDEKTKVDVPLECAP